MPIKHLYQKKYTRRTTAVKTKRRKDPICQKGEIPWSKVRSKPYEESTDPGNNQQG